MNITPEYLEELVESGHEAPGPPTTWGTFHLARVIAAVGQGLIERLDRIAEALEAE